MDFRNEFIENLNKKEKDFFETLAPSYQKNFIEHIYKSKQEKTRLKNLEEVKEALEMNCKNIFDYKKKKFPREEQKEGLTDLEKINIHFNKIENEKNRNIVKNLYFEMCEKNPEIEIRYAWNQPMLVSKKNGTFIMMISVAKNHFGIGLELETMNVFEKEIKDNKYGKLKKGITIKYEDYVDQDMIQKMITFTLEYKKDAKGFWE